MSSLAEKKAAWEAKAVAKTLARAPERQPEFTTSSGIPVERLYTPEDCCPESEDAYVEQLGFPGEYPFTRGVQPTMYRGRFWTMRQYAGFGTAAESQRALQVSAGAGADRPQRRLRPADADRLRLATIRWRSARSARSAWRSPRWPTWRRCSTASRWTRSASA